MFAASLNSGGNLNGRELFLAKLQRKREEKGVEIEPVVTEKGSEQDDQDVDMESSSDSSSSDESSSEESESESEHEEEKSKAVAADSAAADEEELNLLKRKRSEEPQTTETTEEDTVGINHTSIMTRFKQTMSLQTKLESAGETIDTQESNPLENLPINEVKPLPQPALPKDQKLYSQMIKNKNLDWLTKPAYYQTNLTKPFTDLGINEIILKNLSREYGYEQAFSVQVTLIEELLVDIKRQILDPTPRGDYLINAATGSGKTIAYLIPIIQSILTRRRVRDSGLKCIIMVPTKPLISQVYSDALKLTKGTDISISALRGEMNVSEERNKLNNVDIIISTPGRLMEHLEVINFKSLKFLVVDEADKLLNQSYQNWCDSLIDKIEISNNGDLDLKFSLKCIKIVLSATLTTSSEKLTHLRLFRPKLVVVNDNGDELVNELYQLPPLLDEYMIKFNEDMSFYKPILLMKILMKQGWGNHGLIFTKSNEMAIRLGRLLDKLGKSIGLSSSINVKYISSTMKINERQRILKDFDVNGGLLVSTDLLSRGMNFNSIEFVINYDMPMSTKEYVHRIGRTSRGGNSGKALSLVVGEGEFKWFKRLVYSGGVINRNKKTIGDLPNIEEINKFEKEQYEICLKELQREVIIS